MSIVYQGQTALCVGIFFLCYENEIFERSIETIRAGQVPLIPSSWPLRVEERAEHHRPLLLEVAVPLESAI
jgi:hypothetical protein